MQLFLQFCPFRAVFVQRSLIDQFLQLASVMLEHKRFVDEILVTAVKRGLLQCGILMTPNFDHLRRDFSIHACHRHRDFVDGFNELGVGEDRGRLARTVRPPDGDGLLGLFAVRSGDVVEGQCRLHLLSVEPGELKVGMTVEPVFGDGTLKNLGILHFRPAEEA